MTPMIRLGHYLNEYLILNLITRFKIGKTRNRCGLHNYCGFAPVCDITKTVKVAKTSAIVVQYIPDI